MNHIKIVIIFALIALSGSLFAQTNSNCATPTPFCTTQPITYPATTGVPTAAGGGVNFGCLGSTPNPAWFFLQMATSGPVTIRMSANSDIDFAAWGPFSSLTGACQNLNGNMIGNTGGNNGCSFSASNTETFSLANAVAGQFYILLITNYSNQVQNINFSQTNGTSAGAGTTNCGVVCGITLNNSGSICSGENNVLTATTGTSITSYSLVGPSGLIATAPLGGTTNTFVNTVPGIQSTTSFSLLATTSAGSCQAVTTVNVIQYPTFSLTPATPTICQGGNYNAAVTFSPGVNPASYGYNWSAIAPPGVFTAPVPGPGIYSPNNWNTVIGPGIITGSRVTINYTVTVTPLALNCPTTHTFDLVINNPLTPTLNIPPTICNTANPITLTAVPGGGTWSAQGAALPNVSPSGVLTPAAPMAIGINTISYAAQVGTCIVNNTGTIQVSQFNTPRLTSGVNMQCSNQDPGFNLMNIVQSTLTGVWSGPNVVNNIFSTVLPPAPPLPTGAYTLTYNTTSTPNPSVCPSSTTIVVPVFNPPTPTITPIVPLCNNGGTIQLTATPTVGALWQHSAVAALTGVLTPSQVTAFGPNANIIHYSSGQGTCTASNTMAINVNEFRSAALSGAIPDLCFTNNPFNLMSIVQNTSGVWSSTNSIANGLILNNTFNPGGVYASNTSTYPLLYSTSSQPADLLQCRDSRTITVSVLRPDQPNIIQAGPYCNIGGPIQLTVTPTTGTWTATSYLTPSGLFSPSLSPVGNNVVQYVIGTNTCYTQETKSISIEAFVPAIITSSIGDQCNTNSPVNLLPVTSNNLGSWSGSGVVGNNFNPAASGAGSFVLTYNTASSPSGLCPAQTTIAVNVFSLAVPFFSKSGPYCTTSRPEKLGVSPVGGIFGGFNTRAVDASGLFNPAAGVIGNNIVNYSITAGPCVAYAQTTIAVEQFMPADISPAGPFCQNDKRIRLNLNTLAQNAGGVWGGTAGLSGNIFTFADANVGDNVIFYKTESATPGLCPDMKSIHIEVIGIPEVIAKAVVQQNCAPVKVHLYTPSFETGAGSWDFGDGSAPEPGLEIDHVFNTPGTYNIVFTYSLTAGDKFNCSAYAPLDKPLYVFETPKADFNFSPSEIMISSPEVQLNNASSVLGNNRYLWKVTGPSLDKTYNELNPSVLFPQVGEYRVTLSATSTHGCKSDIVKILTVKTDFNVFIPNAFTPNEDYLNDNFMPVFSDYGLDEKNYEMQIFDRWGSLLFTTKDRKNGWNGTVQNKGIQALKPDVYIYKIKYKDVDGNVYSKIGHVTLVR